MISSSWWPGEAKLELLIKSELCHLLLGFHNLRSNFMVIYHICCSSWKIIQVNLATYPLSNAEHQYSCTPIESISVIISSGQRNIIFDFRWRNWTDFFHDSHTLLPKAHSQYEPALRSEKWSRENMRSSQVKTIPWKIWKKSREKSAWRISIEKIHLQTVLSQVFLTTACPPSWFSNSP